MELNEKFLRCKICGNIVYKAADHGPTPVCCGAAMESLGVGTVDAAQEKHVPFITREGNTLKVQIGQVLHPAEEKHHIEFIAVKSSLGLTIKKLVPTAAPIAEFLVPEGEEAQVYEHCNIHGLWAAKG